MSDILCHEEPYRQLLRVLDSGGEVSLAVPDRTIRRWIDRPEECLLSINGVIRQCEVVETNANVESNVCYAVVRVVELDRSVDMSRAMRRAR